MMMRMKSFLRIELHGMEAEDGRIYVNSPDIEGFHFILDPEDDPLEAMRETLTEFTQLYLKAEVRSFSPAPTPKQYLREALDIPRTMLSSRDYSVVAELA